ERQLRKLRQLGSAATYATDYRRISTLMSWNVAALCSQFYEKLKEEFKDLLARFDRPDICSEIIDLAIIIDNRLFERNLEKTFCPRLMHIQNLDNSTPSKNNLIVITQPRVQQMEIDGALSHRPPLTQTEKQRRRDLNLCLYCGNPDHELSSCPRRPQIKVPNTISASIIKENN
ncbi:Retrotransposon-derived protein PEG10, partial [Zancudomyces culisetae]